MLYRLTAVTAECVECAEGAEGADDPVLADADASGGLEVTVMPANVDTGFCRIIPSALTMPPHMPAQ